MKADWLNRRPLRTGITAAALVLFVLWLVARLFAWSACSWYGYQTQRETRYAAFIGCMVKVDDRWFPRNEIRILQ